MKQAKYVTENKKTKLKKLKSKNSYMFPFDLPSIGAYGQFHIKTVILGHFNKGAKTQKCNKIDNFGLQGIFIIDYKYPLE